MAFLACAACGAYAQSDGSSSSTEEVTPAEPVHVTGANIEVVYEDGHAQVPKPGKNHTLIFPGTYVSRIEIGPGRLGYLCRGTRGECVIVHY